MISEPTAAFPAPAYDVIVVGAINVDFVVAANRLPAPGETVVGRGCEQFGGGKGANAAVAAARAGAAVRLVGAVGADLTGENALWDLRDEGVGVDDVAVLSGYSTGTALIVVDPRGENQIAVGAGANAAVRAQYVAEVVSNRSSSTGCVLVSTEICEEAVVAAVEAATVAGLPCVLNPAPVVPAVLKLMHHGPILTPNSTELAELAAACFENGAAGRLMAVEGVPVELGAVVESARRVVAQSHAPVIVTLGSAGALVVTPDGRAEHVPAPAAPVKDTTGAGDTFNGVLAARLAAGDGLALAVRTAVVAASLSVGHAGARTGMPDADLLAAALSPA